MRNPVTIWIISAYIIRNPPPIEKPRGCFRITLCVALFIIRTTRNYLVPLAISKEKPREKYNYYRWRLVVENGHITTVEAFQNPYVPVIASILTLYLISFNGTVQVLRHTFMLLIIMLQLQFAAGSKCWEGPENKDPTDDFHFLPKELPHNPVVTF